jgi:hypothetical protein
MTKGEKIQILDNAINLTYKLLEKAYKEGRDVNEIKTTVDILSYLECYADSLKSRPGEQEGEKEFSIAEAVNPVPKPEIPTPAPEPVESKYSMTDVRAALSKARSKGINVADIIRSFGVENFQQIDASKYPAIMEKLEVATNAT